MSNHRGKLFVDSVVQGALAKRVLLHWCVFFFLSLISLFAIEFFTTGPNITFAEHLQHLWSKYGFFILLMLAIVPTFIYDTVKLSHRFVGPIIRLRNSIRMLADGEKVAELQFRDNDFWSEISEDFNRAARRIDGA